MSPSSKEPSQEWFSNHLFFDGELYGADGDRLLRQVIAPFAEACREEMRRFFFVRYFEEGPHVRLRCLASSERFEAVVRPQLEDLAASSGLVSRIVPRPYVPEVERYGGPRGVKLAEELFYASSTSALALLARIEPGNRPARLGKGLLAMLALLHLYEGDAASAAETARLYGSSFLHIWAPDKAQHGDWYQAFEEGFDRQADRLADYVDAAWDALENDETLTPELDVYRRDMEDVARRLRALYEVGQLQVKGKPEADWSQCVRTIVPSYIHMMSNRLGVTIQEESYLSVVIAKTLAPTAASVPVLAAAVG